MSCPRKEVMGFIMLMTVLALALLAAVTAVVLQFIRARQDGHGPLNRAEKIELALARRVIENVKEMAYEYRDLDSDLSYRLLDTIKEYERKKELS